MRRFVSSSRAVLSQTFVPAFTVFALITGITQVAAGQSGARAKATRKEIGRTSIGTPTAVFVEPGTISRNGTIVTAAIRVALVPPLKHPKGELRSSRTLGMYDCARRTVATRESWYYLDDAGRREGMHRQVKIPGFGPIAKGSVADVAFTYLCATP